MHPSISLETLTSDSLTPFLNTEFTIHGDTARRSQVTLTEITAFGQRIAGQRDQFSLVFSGTRGEVWPQSIYRLEHGDLGALELFLVPLSTSPDETRYEAIFA